MIIRRLFQIGEDEQRLFVRSDGQVRSRDINPRAIEGV
jgi:hypothetical protein